jgi:hypothetical protein
MAGDAKADEPVMIGPGIYRAEGPTPNGGAYSEAYFSDEQGNPVLKEDAVFVEIHEINADGNSIYRTYGTIERPGQPVPEETLLRKPTRRTDAKPSDHPQPRTDAVGGAGS